LFWPKQGRKRPHDPSFENFSWQGGLGEQSLKVPKIRHFHRF